MTSRIAPLASGSVGGGSQRRASATGAPRKAWCAAGMREPLTPRLVYCRRACVAGRSATPSSIPRPAARRHRDPGVVRELAYGEVRLLLAGARLAEGNALISTHAGRWQGRFV